MPVRPKKQAPYSKWMHGKDVKALRIKTATGYQSRYSLSQSHPSFARGEYGRIFRGLVTFANGKRQKVAIKMFDEPLSNKEAAAYERAIQKIAEADIPTLKTAMVNWNGKWVKVSPLLENRAGIKLARVKTDYGHARQLSAPRTQRRVGQILGKMINAGFAGYIDAIDYLRQREAGIVAIDLDVLVRTEPSFENVKRLLAESLNKFPEESRRQILEKHVLPEIRRPALRKKLAQLEV
ncbi:MAG: hypothetical protein CL943_01905 [Candidatus Diapherotrites archaeon]|uniref:Uncharacterized protein n=1 Tax=Candidatus Iainarchaeum sp. TaxID=3101447 RepID=A0A2D6M0U7_9ARCH|nr:hypothetical protein [Candidatus Diapherotrites archaeon]|tara:strand:- start:1030 stop:1740 length:711 start_codon:yes stop_codon:yes gene_type:complete